MNDTPENMPSDLAMRIGNELGHAPFIPGLGDEPTELDIESSMTEFIESLETTEDEALPWFIPDSQRAKAGAE